MIKPFRFASRGALLRQTLRGVLLATLLAAPVIAHAQNEERARRLFEECAACHGNEKAENVGPNLAGLIGRRAGSRDDFRYSGPLKRSGIEWTPAALEQFIADPQALVPGNRMPYSGMADAADRKVLVDYLARTMR
jgi:cytochrome c